MVTELTELFIKAFRHPMTLVWRLLFAASASIVPSTCNRAFRPSSSMNLRTKLCGCVLRAVFRASTWRI